MLFLATILKSFFALRILGYRLEFSLIFNFFFPKRGFPPLNLFTIIITTFLIFIDFPNPKFMISPFAFLLFKHLKIASITSSM